MRKNEKVFVFFINSRVASLKYSRFTVKLIYQITVKCPCGRREEHVECSKGGAHIQSINSALSAAKGSVDMRKLIQPGTGNYRYWFMRKTYISLSYTVPVLVSFTSLLNRKFLYQCYFFCHLICIFWQWNFNSHKLTSRRSRVRYSVILGCSS